MSTDHRIACHGIIYRPSGRPCPDRARLGSRFCGRHEGQMPATPVRYLRECLSAVVPRPTRVHLSYLEQSPARLLCTGSSALAGVVLSGLAVCPRCRGLAREAVARGELEPDDVRRFDLGEPNVDEARS